DRLARHTHVRLQRLSSLELGPPVAILVRAVHPEEQLLLGTERLASAPVDRLDGLKGLEVIWHVVREVFEKGGAEAQTEVDALVLASLAQVSQYRLDDLQVGPVVAAEMHIPLVLTHRSEDHGLRRCHSFSLLKLRFDESPAHG